MEFLILIVVGVIYSFLVPSKSTNQSKNSTGFSSIEKYKMFENVHKR